MTAISDRGRQSCTVSEASCNELLLSELDDRPLHSFQILEDSSSFVLRFITFTDLSDCCVKRRMC